MKYQNVPTKLNESMLEAARSKYKELTGIEPNQSFNSMAEAIWQSILEAAEYKERAPQYGPELQRLAGIVAELWFGSLNSNQAAPLAATTPSRHKNPFPKEFRRLANAIEKELEKSDD